VPSPKVQLNHGTRHPAGMPVPHVFVFVQNGDELIFILCFLFCSSFIFWIHSNVFEDFQIPNTSSVPFKAAHGCTQTGQSRFVESW
jgi:hypothetical protein